VVNFKNEILWMASATGGVGRAEGLDPVLAAALVPRFTTFAGAGDSTHGLVLVSGRPLLAAGRPLSHPSDLAATGAVVVCRYLTGSALRDGGLDVAIWAVGDLEIPAEYADASSRVTARAPVALVQRSRDTLDALAVVADVDGQPALLIRAEIPRAALNQGMRTSRFAMLSIAFTGMALLLLVLGLLETVVFSRLHRLADGVEHIRESGDLSARLPETGNDEIRRVSRNLNRLLAEVESGDKRLKEGEQRYRSLFEGASDGIFVLLDHRIVDCNATAIKVFGPDKQQIVGHLIFRFLPPIQPDGHDSRREWMALTETVAAGPSQVREWRFRRLDGSVLDAEVVLSRVVCGGAHFVEVFFRDRTARREAEAEKRRLEAQMIRAQKLESLGALAGGIAHEFDNALGSVLGVAERALQEMPEGAPARSVLEEIRKSAARASDLSRQMMVYAGKGPLATQVVDVNAVVNEVKTLLQVPLSKKAVLRLHLAEAPPPVEVDLPQFRNALLHLVTNASEAIGDRPGTITVRTGVVNADAAYLSQTYLGQGLQEGPYVFVEIQDTGCGMDAETRARVFEPFFTTKFGARGLGLAAVLGAVRAHKGTIHVYSEVGHGATFKVLIPISPKVLDGKTPSPPPTIAEWRGSGTILVADDEEPMRNVSRLMIEKGGFTVVTAVDGQDAIDVFRRHAPEIVAVLLDLSMPRLSGEETFDELNRIRPGIPVLLSSGYDEVEACRRFGHRKPAGFVQKPFERLELMRRLRSALATVKPPDLPRPQAPASAQEPPAIA
jgi:PAS domain S-box-containing protein